MIIWVDQKGRILYRDWPGSMSGLDSGEEAPPAGYILKYSVRQYCTVHTPKKQSTQA